ncbi:MAG TPA: ethanolamine ammonia lyase-activating protein, partial [Chloroflexota bacterium]|nr:ethanolamine ammonia lyase-activating protein [Chloroflexota bacterium]
MAIQQQDPAADDLEELQRPDAYAQWQKREGVRVIEDFLFDDLNAIELGSWPRKGGKGAIINIPNPALPNDAHLVEIGPGGHSEPESHLYEEMVYILRGHGAASVWFDEQHKQTFEWGEGSLFAIPLNTSYQLFNGSGSDSARYISVTNLPPMIRLFQNAEFVFNNPFRFRDRFSGEHGYFSGEGKLYRGRKWQSNFIPDAAGMKLYGWKERGAGGVNAMLELPQNNLAAHISEFPVGTYKKAHRHGPGAHLVILSGDGFSMVWREGEERRKLDWRKGGMVIVPWEDTFHQHFNAGAEPARYLALRGGGGINRGGNRPGADLSIKLGGWQVEYEDEDPEI